MNDTNRAVNRLLLLLIGLVLLGVGGAVILAATWPVATEIWRRSITTASDWLARSAEATRIADTGLSWLVLGVLAAIVIVVVLLVLAIARLGGGRSRALLTASLEDNPLGRVVVRDAFAADALTAALDARPDVVSTRVTAAEVRDETVLHIAVTARRNASPRALALDVNRLASNVAALTGQDLPTYVSVRSGLRARLAPERRDLA
ncbi:hypothetical protein [Microbacterium sp. P05]|uniref:hypothetical protein n=1 Tax=Microbacterium sp. P05 TaxID=3366948 RepID=UPI003745F5BE